MVQAAASGAIDFAAADLLDRRWWTKVRWILDRIEETNVLTVLQLQHAQHASVVNYNLSKEAFDQHWNGGNDLIKTVHDIQFPWAKKQQAAASNRGRSDLLEEWKQRFGDYKDPEVRKHYDRVAKAMHERNKAVKAAYELPGTKQRQALQKLIAGRQKQTRKR
jgi:hypothetical protein